MGSIGAGELIVVALIGLVMLAVVVGAIVLALVLAKRSTRPPRP